MSDNSYAILSPIKKEKKRKRKKQREKLATMPRRISLRRRFFSVRDRRRGLRSLYSARIKIIISRDIDEPLYPRWDKSPRAS